MTEDTLQINTLGLDRQMIKQRIDKANVASLEKQMNDFKELGRKIIACEMTMKIMGLSKEGLRMEWMDKWGAVVLYPVSKERECNSFYLRLEEVLEFGLSQ